MLQDQLSLLAHNLLDVKVTIDIEKQNTLNEFLTLILSCNLNRREASLQQLVDVLASHR